MMTLLTIILIISIIFQLSAVFYALWLIRITGLKYSWILISIALFFMCVRRLIPLYHISVNINYTIDLTNEIIGLILSFLMLIGFRGIGFIFIERKQAVEALREIEEQFQTISSLSPAGIYLTDPDGNCLYANKAWCKMAGLRLEEALGKGWVNGLHPDDRDMIFANWNKMVESNGTWGLEYRFRNKEGNDTWVYGLAVPQYNASGKIIKYIGVNHDITARKTAEEEMNKRLSEKNIILKEVHHRIKNNIASIESLLLMQLQTVRSKEAVSVLQDAIGRVSSMLILYDKLLISEDYKDISAKNYIESLIDAVLALFQNNLIIKSEMHIDEFNLPAENIFPLGIIINELLTNIMKYAFVGRESGLINISLNNIQNKVILIIQDNGNGLPDGFNISKSNGFGLMLVTMLSEQSGGTFSIENHNGTRSILTFEI